MIKIPFDLKKDNPQTMIFIALASMLALVIYFRFLLIPQVTWLADILGSTGKVMSSLKSGHALIAKRDEFRKNIESYREKVESYEKRLPAEQEIPSLLEDLSRMAKGSNVKIVGITPVAISTKEKATQKGKVYKEIPILINAKSGYHELGTFLSNMENAGRFMKVVDIEIKASKPSPNKHDVELIVCTYISSGEI